jgi:hypothetical protein
MPGAPGDDFHGRLKVRGSRAFRLREVGEGSIAAPQRLAGIILLTLLCSCGGGGGGSAGGSSAPPFTSVTQIEVSQASTYAADCSGVTQVGTLYPDTALEPSLVVNPTNSANLVAEWQQDRWSNGGSQALNLAASFDGGTTWTLSNAAFSICSGGSSSNAGNFARASNGWLTVDPNGVVYALSLSFTGPSLEPGSTSGQLVARSTDGGLTWSSPVALINDSSDFFDDKGSITADPTDANYVYAVWDRISGNFGPSYFAMTAAAGASWQSAVSIYDPGEGNQTIGNQIVVLPGDILLDIFTELDDFNAAAPSAALRETQSTDHGMTWSVPVTITSVESVGTTEPLGGEQVRDAADLFAVSVAADGRIYIVWQDARFSGGKYDGIALTQSGDGGATWSQPVQVNADTATPAFTPTVNVSADGLIAVTYYDFRNDVVPGEGLIDCWMVTSSDGVSFQESHLSGPFNLDLASYAAGEGLFLGDYQSLRSSGGGAFLPFYTQTPASGSQLRSGVFLDFPPVSTAAAASAVRFRAMAAPLGATLDAAARQRVAQSIRRVRAARLQRGR